MRTLGNSRPRLGWLTDEPTDPRLYVCGVRRYVDRIIRDKDQEYLFSALLTAM